MDPAMREYLTKLRAVAFLEIKTGLGRYGRGARKEHRVERSGAVEAGDGDEGRSRRREHRRKLLG